MPTLPVQLHVNVVGKLQTHSAARYSPSLRQTAQATSLAATGAKWAYPAEAWGAWCREAPQRGEAASFTRGEEEDAATRQRESHTSSSDLKEDPTSQSGEAVYKET